MIRARTANVTILYSHGNAEDLNSSFSWMRRLSRELNVNVVGYDYTGYGLSTGIPSEHNCYSDIESVYEHLIKVKGLAPHQIVLYGRSLGSGPSCWLASKTSREGNPVGGLLLHSPFTSVYRVVMNVGFTLAGDKFSNVDKIPTVACPVMICHGREDTVVPFAHGVELHNSVPPEYQAKPHWMDDVGHNDHGPVVEAALLTAFNKYLDYHILARRLYMSDRKNRNTSLTSQTRVKRRTVVIRREV